MLPLTKLSSESSLSVIDRTMKKNNGFSKHPDIFQVTSYVLVLVNGSYFYGIYVPMLATIAVQAPVVIVYTINLVLLAWFAVKLSLDDPTELVTLKTRYYKTVM